MIKYFLCIALFIFSITSQAREIYYGSQPELVSISKETIFRFHKQVRTISQAHKFEIKPADPNDPDYSLLSVRPRFTKGTSKVAFVLSDGAVVTLKIKIVKRTKNSVEPFYDLRPKSMLIERSEKNLPVITVMDFMKSVDRDDNIVGYKRKVERRRLFTRGNRCVKARLIRSYTGKEYKGFVVQLKNVCNMEIFKIEVNKLKFRGSSLAIMSLVNNEVLFPKVQGSHKTLLKIAAKPTASVDNLIILFPTKMKRKENKYEFIKKILKEFF